MAKKILFLVSALLLLNSLRANFANSTLEAQSYNAQGLTLCTEEKWVSAIDLFKKATECDSKFSSAWNNLAIALYKGCDLDGAVEAIKKSIELNSLDPEIHYNLGTFLLEKNDTQGAMGAFLKAIDISPKFDKALFSLGMLKLRENNLEEAYQLVKAACGEKTDELYLNTYGQICLSLGKAEDALNTYKKVKELYPSIDNKFNLANAYYLTDNFQQALGLYKELVKLDAGDVRFWNNLGETYIKVEDNINALRSFIKAKDLQPNLTNISSKIDFCLSLLSSKF